MEKIFAVINLGSSHISGMLATRQQNGRIVPLAQSRKSSRGVIHGYIHNINDAGAVIGSVLDDLSEALDERSLIKRVYVGLDCQSMRSHLHTERLSFDGEGVILEQEHLQQLYERAQAISFPRLSVVRITDPSYYVDGRREQNPRGIRCHTLEVVYQVITIREDIRRNIYEVFETKQGLQIEELLVAPLAEASVTLTKEEIILGCAYINIGGGTTSISVYKDRLLRGLYVLPLGGHNVTRDLMHLKLLEQDAEQVKLRYGSMDTEVSKELTITATSISGTGDKQISLYEVNSYIQARMQELTENVKALIREIDPEQTIGAIVFSGGATRLKGYMDSLSLEHGGRRADARPDILAESADPVLLGEYQTVLGLLSLATNPCVEYQVVPLTDLFAGEDSGADATEEALDDEAEQELGGYIFHDQEDEEEEETAYDERKESYVGQKIKKFAHWLSSTFGEEER